jgi:hypothetical protein
MPAAPANLTVQDTGTGTSLYASWDGYNDPTFSHYNVYHSTSMGPWENPATTSATNFTIAGLSSGQLYYVAVSSVDTFGNESYLVYSSGVPYSIPLLPTGLADQPLPTGVRLDWDENQELDIDGYLVFRSLSEGETGTQLTPAPISPTEYLDANVTGSPDLRYYYRIRAVDNQGNQSPLTDPVWSRPLTLNQGILIIDETANLSGTTPFQPNDEQVDDFYSDAMCGFEWTDLDLDQLEQTMKLADIGIYSSILWHGNDFSSMDYPYVVRDALQQYIAAGGNILFSLYLPSQAFELNSNYPASFGPNTFINGVIGIEAVQYSNNARFNAALPQTVDYSMIEVDPDKIPASMNGHILQVEAIIPNASSQGIYKYGSAYAESTPQGFLLNQPVGVYNAGAASKVVTLSFPLYYMKLPQVQTLAVHVFNSLFGENYVPVDDPNAPPLQALGIRPNRPNPFGASTAFEVDLKDSLAPLGVAVYNLRGQLVRELFNGPAAKSGTYEWDGTDASGRPVSNGVYFIRAAQGADNATRRVLLIRN